MLQALEAAVHHKHQVPTENTVCPAPIITFGTWLTRVGYI